MRFRALAVAVAAVLAVGTLSGCRTNIGLAAVANGHRITESELSSYVTPNAQSINGQRGSTPPKPFALDILIGIQLYRALLAKTPAGEPSPGMVSSMVTQYLNGRSALSVAESLGVHGYSASFAQQVVIYSRLGALLERDLQSGVDVNRIARNLTFPVSVNPRYGVWDARHFSLKATPAAGRPAYLRLQPGTLQLAG